MNTNIENLLDRTAEYLLKYDASEDGKKCADAIQNYYEYRPNFILGCLDYARKFAYKAQTIDIDEDANEFISVVNKAYHAWTSSMKTQNENITKNKIRITEKELKQIVAESVKRVLNEARRPSDKTVGKHTLKGLRYDKSGNPLYTSDTMSDDEKKNQGWRFSKKHGMYGQLSDPTKLSESKLKQIVAESVKKVLNEGMSEHEWALSYVQNILGTIDTQIKDLMKMYVYGDAPSHIEYLTIEECYEIEEKARMFSGLLHSTMKKHWINRNKSIYKGN